MTRAEFTEDVQRAAAFVAARSRGDRAAAHTLLKTFECDATRAQAFAALAELAIAMIAREEGESVNDVAARLALTLAQV